MMNDIDIDIEELESRLYSQVYHSSVDICEDRNTVSNVCDGSSNVPQNLRYFHLEQPMSSKSGKLNYIHLTSDIAKSKTCATDFFDSSPDNNSNSKQEISINNQAPQSVGSSNDNDVLPSIPTQVLPNSDTPIGDARNVNVESSLNKQSCRQRKRQKWLEHLKRKKMNEIISRLAKIDGFNHFTAHNTKKSNFRVHYLNETTANQQDNSIVTISDSESNDSSVELLNSKQDLIVVSSGESDAEDKNINGLIDKENEIIKDNIESVEINDDSQVEEIKVEDKSQENVGQVPVSTQDDDDDVLFVDDMPENLEVIEIDCDSKSVTNIKDGKVSCGSMSINSVSKQPESGVKQRTLTAIKERNELLKTPDSTSTSNDFLDNNVDLQQKRFNFGLHGSDFNNTETFVKPQSQTDLFETESSCSASENNIPIKTNVFKEVEFESPSKDLFNEENLESFGNYITPNRSSISQNKTSPCENFDQVLTKASVKAIRKLTSECSDTSSESDYEMRDETSTKKADTKQLPILTSMKSQNLLVEQATPLEHNTNLNESASNKRKKSIWLEDVVIPEKKARDVSLLSASILHSESQCESNKNTEDGPLLSTAINILRSVEKCKTTQNTKDSEIEKATAQEIIDNPYESDLSNKAIRSEDNDLNQIKKTITDIELLNSKNAQEEPENVGKPENVLKIDNAIKNTEGNYSFSYYWTSDMNKFYNTSWGLENFDIKDIQKTMSTDSKLWRVSDEDRNHYKTGGHKRRRCNNCRELGHIAVNCASPQRRIVCTLCGQIGHVEARCPNGLCTLCGSRGGYSTYCSKCAKWRYMQCQICNMQGHLAKKCPDLWRRYHLTIKPGPIVKPLKTIHKNIEDRWCSGCGSAGHYEYLCRFYMRHYHAADPHVQEYQDVYNFPKNQPFLIRCLEMENPRGEIDNTNTATADEPTQSTSKENSGSNKNKSVNETATNVLKNLEKMVHVNNENNIQVTFENFIFPSKEMIPAYFLKQMEDFENSGTANVTNSECHNTNDRRYVRSPNAESEFKTPSNLNMVSNNTRTSCTVQLNYKLYGFIHSKNGVKLVNQFQNLPDISLTVIKSCDEPYPSGKITICGRGKDVRDIQQQLLKLFRSVPQIDILPKFSKALSNLLLTKFCKVDKIVGNCKVLYKNLMKLQAELRAKKDAELKRKIRSCKIHLNMLLFGKLGLADGRLHMDHLQHCQKEFEKKANHKIPLNILFDILDSYAYIFLDSVNHQYSRLCGVQEDNKRRMDKQVSHKGLKLCTHYFKLVEVKCRKFNLLNKLEELNHFQSILHKSNFSVKAFKEFMTFCNKFLHSVKTHNL